MGSGKGFTGLVVAVGIGLAQPTLRAGEKEFDFQDPKRVNAINFVLDSPLEPMMGVASGISGKVKFDPADPRRLAGTITLEAASLYMPHKGMTDTLHGPDWLDVKKHPKIEFTFKEIKEAKKLTESTAELTVVGEITCKGIRKPIHLTVKASYLAGRLGDRLQKQKGDLLVLRSTFSIRRSDFDIKPNQLSDVVAEEIEIRVSIVGLARES